ncbi:hypothetical protein [Microbacterium sp. gxy059]|uniref:hypothetical protein n=1 Tax=Microbacterium sp. gxy059 TaxID=2957199 RepID=UPI003D95C4F3
MTLSSPPLGLLLDVDGPIASTRTRTLRVASIARDLVACANAGCPVVFNTGRSSDFLAERIIPVLAEEGLLADAPVWGVGEKGGTWFALVADAPTATVGEVQQDDAMRPPEELVSFSRDLADRFRDLVFFDETKRTMISIEQHVDVPNDDFLARRDELVAELDSEIRRLGVQDQITIYPTVISIDVEHVDSGKALGARRALAFIRQRAEPPARWFTAGDSGQDYDMAAQLHDDGFTATHLDVRPEGDVPEVPFEVIRELPMPSIGVAEDDLTARHLARLRDELGF